MKFFVVVLIKMLDLVEVMIFVVQLGLYLFILGLFWFGEEFYK